MDHSEKILLAACILVAVFLSTNLMLVPLLRRRRDTRESQTWKALGNLLRPPRNSGQDAMEELGRRVEKLKQEKPTKGDDEV